MQAGGIHFEPYMLVAMGSLTFREANYLFCSSETSGVMIQHFPVKLYSLEAFRIDLVLYH